jgi:hypothetical protein
MGVFLQLGGWVKLISPYHKKLMLRNITRALTLGSLNAISRKTLKKEPACRSRCRWEDIKRHSKKHRVWGHELDTPSSGQGKLVGCGKHRNELLGSIKDGKCLE